MRRAFKTTGTDRGKRLVDLPDKRNTKKPKILNPEEPTPVVNNEAADPTPDVNTEDGPEDVPATQYGIHFLDLHTGNPIVSFKGDAYSCTWTDMIGTNMFFSQPKETPLYDPEISTNDFDMIGISQIKLVGNPIKVTPIPQNAAASTAKTWTRNEAPTTPLQSGKSLGTIRRSNAKVNADLRKQANFLEQLMNIKKNRGERDNVHVVMNSKISKAAAAGKLKFRTKKKQEEIDELNRRIVRGDGEALRKLENMYSGRDEDSDDYASADEEAVEAAGQVKDHQVPNVDLDGELDSPVAQPEITSTTGPSAKVIADSETIDTNNNDG